VGIRTHVGVRKLCLCPLIFHARQIGVVDMKTVKRVVAQKGDKKKASGKNDDTVVLSREDYEKLLALIKESQQKAEKKAEKKKEWVIVKQLKPIPTSDAVSLVFALAKWGDTEYISVSKVVKGKVVQRHAYPSSILVNALKQLL